MKKFRGVAFACFLILSLAIDVGGIGRDAYVDPVFRPIGIVHTFGGVTVNGRPAQAHDELWGGELIETRTMTSALVVLHSIGQITLSGGTRARLSVSHSNNQINNNALVASLVSGELKVVLRTGATAYFEAGGSGYTASDGASFSCALRDDEAAIETVKGSVVEERAIREQTPLPVKVSIDRRFSAKSNGTATVRVQVTQSETQVRRYNANWIGNGVLSCRSSVCPGRRTHCEYSSPLRSESAGPWRGEPGTGDYRRAGFCDHYRDSGPESGEGYDTSYSRRVGCLC